MASEFEKILNHNEKIIWQGAPQVGPFIILSFFSYPFAVGLIFLSLQTSNSIGVPLFLPFILILLGILFLFIPLIVFIECKKTFYAITDKRVIIQSGIIGTDFQVVDFDKINNMEVKVGISDKLFGDNSGTISIDSGRVETTSKGGTYSVLQSLIGISDPYAVFEKLKKVSHDIKTDIEYPNKLRPDTNPGYNTKY